MIRRVSMAQLQTDVSESRLLGYSRWAVALTAGAMFTYVWRFKVGPVPTNVLEILVLATIALYVVGRFQTGSWRPRRMTDWQPTNSPGRATSMPKRASIKAQVT